MNKREEEKEKLRKTDNLEKAAELDRASKTELVLTLKNTFS